MNNIRLSKKYLKVAYFLIGFLAVSLASFLNVGDHSTQNNPDIQEKINAENKSPGINSLDKLQDKNLHKVVKVVDGDTIDVDISGKTERLRMIGVNTPETVDPRNPVECFGKEASGKTKEMLSGKMVYLESDQTQSDKDKYGRILRYIFLEDGTNYNYQLILMGYAYEYTYDIPYKYQKEFKDAQVEARKNSAGLWSSSACSGVK